MNGLEKIQIKDLMKNQDYIDSILKTGALEAKQIADPILKRTYEIVGLLNS